MKQITKWKNKQTNKPKNNKTDNNKNNESIFQIPQKYMLKSETTNASKRCVWDYFV